MLKFEGPGVRGLTGHSFLSFRGKSAVGSSDLSLFLRLVLQVCVWHSHSRKAVVNSKARCVYSKTVSLLSHTHIK